MTDLSMPAERVRFSHLDLQRLPNGECHVRVGLSWQNRDDIVGEARGMVGEPGELRCAAQACLNALTTVLTGTALELLGVKAVRAFDSTVVIVSLTSSGPGEGPRLVGSCIAEHELARGAVLAVLNATNRMVSRQG